MNEDVVQLIEEILFVIWNTLQLLTLFSDSYGIRYEAVFPIVNFTGTNLFGNIQLLADLFSSLNNDKDLS